MKTINIARPFVVLAVIAILFGGPIAHQTHALRVPLKVTAQPVRAVEPGPPVNGKIAFTHFDFPNGEQIATVNDDGTNLTLLTAPFVNSEGPAFSPDGSQIAFSQVTSIWIMNADGSQQRFLPNTSANANSNNPAWSPDGTKIAFSRDYQIWVVNVDGTNAIQLSDGTTLDDFAAWSPDGSKIAFVKDYFSANAQIYVMSSDGSNPVNLTNSIFACRHPAWSPDGSRIAYDSVSEIFTMNPDGSNQTQISTTPYVFFNEDPAWSPDGSKIAFDSYRDGNAQIYIMNADGTNEARVTNSLAQDNRPSWGPVPSGNTPAGTNVSVTIGAVQITFSNVTQAGQTTVTPIDPNSAGTLPGQYSLTGDSLAFEVATTAIYSGPITVCIVDSSVADQATFDSLRILHGEGGVLVDRTILPPDAPAPDFSTRTICARVDSLSPFVIAKLNPLYGVQALYDQTKAVKSGSTLPIKLQLTNSGGANVSSSSILVTALSVLRISTNTSGAVQDSGNANPDNNFRFSGGAYIFNLSTKGYATGTYLLKFKAGSDPIVHTVQFQVK